MTLNQALISEYTLSTASPSSSVDIVVPSGYTDLRLVISGRGNLGQNYTNLYMRLNGDSASNYTGRILYGDGSNAASALNIGGQAQLYIGTLTGANATGNVFGNTEIYIPNYSSNVAKTINVDAVMETNGNPSYVTMTAGVWSGTAAITTINVLIDGSSTFQPGTSFTLYGITKLGVTPTQTPKATGGDIIKNDGTYWYHAFLSTGAFIPQQALSADILVIAGGGGGSAGGGGGGAGGIFYSAANTLTATNYTCTVGAGGTGGYENKGTNGGNSQFGSLTTAVGGGAGGSDYVETTAGETGNNGGSGGGMSQNPTHSGAIGNGTSGQGNNGGTGYAGGPGYGGGAGGGAGAAGGNGTSTTAGNGGVGSSAYSSWGSVTGTGHNVSSTYYYAGGGGGGLFGSGTASTGGYGGGGAGGQGTAAPGTAATINTGGGGGASSGGAGGGQGAAGGSGIVIVRYAMA